MSNKQYLPTEVRLAWEVMTCKAMRETYDDQSHPCHYFNQHFGPYLAYDWIEESSSKMNDAEESREIDVLTNGNRFSVPALCGGCRKAPIMTIGINPNMASWQLNTNGSSWAYPYFDDIGEFATYYRYQTIYQEKFDIDFLKKFIDPATAIKAAKAGVINSIKRDNNDDGFIVELQYDGENTPTAISQPRKALVLVNQKKRFNANDIIAGIVKLPVGEKTTITQETVGYYMQFASIFKIAKDKLVKIGKIPADADLHNGEDVLLGDMIACASPGWTAQSGGIPKDYRKAITQACCVDRRALALQFQQTNPAIIVFSGYSAFSMFKETFSGISFTPTIPSNLSATYLLLRFTLKNRVMMSVQKGATPTRIIVSPHFSYKINFTPCYAFSEDEWNTFKSKWPTQAKLLGGKLDQGQVLISLDNEYATPEKMGEAWNDLNSQFIDPCSMIADIIVDEFKNGNISYDKKTKHLTRTDGPCRFCSNQLFEIAEGCIYKKDSEPMKAELNAILKTAADKMVTG